eukprot:Gb_20458 [translate_table: standard]
MEGGEPHLLLHEGETNPSFALLGCGSHVGGGHHHLVEVKEDKFLLRWFGGRRVWRIAWLFAGELASGGLSVCGGQPPQFVIDSLFCEFAVVCPGPTQSPPPFGVRMAGLLLHGIYGALLGMSAWFVICPTQQFLVLVQYATRKDFVVLLFQLLPWCPRFLVLCSGTLRGVVLFPALREVPHF